MILSVVDLPFPAQARVVLFRCAKIGRKGLRENIAKFSKILIYYFAHSL